METILDLWLAFYHKEDCTDQISMNVSTAQFLSFDFTKFGLSMMKKRTPCVSKELILLCIVCCLWKFNRLCGFHCCWCYGPTGITLSGRALISRRVGRGPQGELNMAWKSQCLRKWVWLFYTAMANPFSSTFFWDHCVLWLHSKFIFV